MAGWIGVDLDGTLAHFDRWRGPRHIGLPIPAMAKRVHDWHARGVEVRIFTARASRPELIPDVQDWLNRHGFPPLAVTNQKDFGMVELWDDRAIQVLYNTGKAVRPNRLEDVEKAELFDPDEDVVYADDGADTKEIKPSSQEVEDFKRNIRASTDDSIDSLDDLLDALDDGEYAPGNAPAEPTAMQTAKNATAADMIADDHKPDLQKRDLEDQGSASSSTGFTFADEEEDADDLFIPTRAVVEIELTAEGMDAQGDGTLEIEQAVDPDTVEFEPLPTGILSDKQNAGEVQIQSDAPSAEVTTQETTLDNTLDDQPLNEVNSLDDFDDLDLDSALDDVPDDLRSPSVNDYHERPKPAPMLTTLPEDELDDYLDDLPTFRVERR